MYYFLDAHEIEEKSRFSVSMRKHSVGDEPDQVFPMMKWTDPTPNNPYVSPLRLITLEMMITDLIRRLAVIYSADR